MTMGSQDWWARKMRGDVAPPRQELTPIRVVPSPQARSVPSHGPSQRGDTCPGCGSGNYTATSRGGAARCFECSYGSPIQNSTQGMSAPHEGVATPAVQVESAGYSPGTIVGRVE